MASDRRARHGFTLIELLIVVALLTFVAVLLFPVFARVREQARQATCSAHLRQIALAFRLYADDHDGAWPLTGFTDAGSVGPVTRDTLWQGWFGAPLQPYLRSRESLYCPSDNVTGAERGVESGLQRLAEDLGVARLSYGVNHWLGEVGKQSPGAGPTMFPYPSQTAMLADCATLFFTSPVQIDHEGRRSSTIAYANVPPEDREWNTCSMGRPGQERHGDGSNVVFVDGRVRHLRASQFLQQRRVRDGMLVEYPIVHPTAVPP
jgi:prepilin-type N-terminal cleavage/methylation domain-containing protein/prepilin-type processing-associated H-X9-DG protein